MTPTKASLKTNENIFYHSLQEKRKKRKSKYKPGDLVETADKRNIFSKGDSTNWSYELYFFTAILDDTVPSYRINYLPERYNESLLQKSKLSFVENDNFIKTLNI